MFTVHKAKEEEIAKIKDLLYFTWVDTYRNIYSQQTIDKVTSVWHSHEALRNQILDPNTYFAVAKDENDEIMGMVTAYKRDNEEILISKLYVYPAHQRKGIGKRLFDEALQAFGNVKKVRLEVEKDNPKGVSFYKKHGFEMKETKQDNVQGEIVTCTVMERSFA
ncbi:MAG: GNAT family N-acetyltransferase [Candidatus Levybacteria bacterium]|nr:GNAT family N-acetyltransferase [Candidatus Levybacteria bacterium]